MVHGVKLLHLVIEAKTVKESAKHGNWIRDVARLIRAHRQAQKYTGFRTASSMKWESPSESYFDSMSIEIWVLWRQKLTAQTPQCRMIKVKRKDPIGVKKSKRENRCLNAFETREVEWAVVIEEQRM